MIRAIFKDIHKILKHELLCIAKPRNELHPDKIRTQRVNAILYLCEYFAFERKITNYYSMFIFYKKNPDRASFISNHFFKPQSHSCLFLFFLFIRRTHIKLAIERTFWGGDFLWRDFEGKLKTNIKSGNRTKTV